MSVQYVPVARHFEPSFPFIVFLVSCFLYLAGRAILSFVTKAAASEARLKLATSGYDKAEKGTLVEKQRGLSEEERFCLEKRAFFSKSWLFVCHKSRFPKAGDYQTFTISDIPFFVVFGKDGILRTFHNVCRHRAYTVVRKACGNTNRFSCKYHGWQYDIQGSLIKAPKFEESPGFIPEENSLFEVKSIVTKEGLLFVNFDNSNPLHLSYRDVKSKFEIGDSHYVDSFTLASANNWKVLGQAFREQVAKAQPSFRWTPWTQRKTKVLRLLGPTSLLKELDQGLWMTMNISPISCSESEVRCDIYAAHGTSIAEDGVRKLKLEVEKELSARSSTRQAGTDCAFTYEVGGRTIDLSAILAQHERHEYLMKRKVQPAIRIVGDSEVDAEAAALCDEIDMAAAHSGTRNSVSAEW